MLCLVDVLYRPAVVERAVEDSVAAVAQKVVDKEVKTV